MKAGWAFGAAFCVVGCWGGGGPVLEPPPDGGHPDAGPTRHPDAGSPRADAGVGVDAGPLPDAGPPPLFDGGPPLGSGISAPPNAWTWVDFPNSSCDDGSPTGIGINPSTQSSNVLVYFEGGGACWDYTTCYVLNTATHGPYAAAQFGGGPNTSGSIFDRARAENPFKDWSFVYVPYCTGDVHTGDNVMTYTLGGTSKQYHHKGHANAMAFLERLGPTFPAPAKVIITGSSAGGGGVTSNYAYARWYWPNARMYFLDDSLPFFQKGEMPASTPTWIANWGTKPLLDAMCGAACEQDLSRLYPALRAHYPQDRMALLSSQQDGTIRQYYQMSAVLFQADLNGLAAEVLHPADIQTFFVNGSTHTMLYNPGSFTTSQSMPLWTWLTQMTTDDPAWTSAGP